MLKINFMSTLFVGIDVSSKSNVVYAMDFYKNKYIQSSFSNNQPGADELSVLIRDCMASHTDLNTVVIALESTSVYSIHIASHLVMYMVRLHPQSLQSIYHHRKSLMLLRKNYLLF